jgi:small GTP-binding protein
MALWAAVPIIIDTGGLRPDTDGGIYADMARQTEQAIVEADAVVLVTDARAGLTPGDRVIADKLRRLKDRVWIAANKSEGMDPATAAAEFHELGLGNPVAISAAHGNGVGSSSKPCCGRSPDEPEVVDDAKNPRVAIVGRPNVGKSTLVNALVGEERVLVYDKPGTTRDAIEVPFERNGRRYTLVDTAGLRKRGKSHGAEVEKFSIVKTLQAIEAANVAVLVLDAVEGITEQDAHVASYILDRGRAVTVAVNKWEAADKAMRDRLRTSCAGGLDSSGSPTPFSSPPSRARASIRSAALGRCAYAAAMAEALDAEADARADRGSRAPDAPAPQGLCAAQDALCAPGRLQSAARDHPRQFAAARARMPTSGSWRAGSATPSSCRERPCASNCAPAGIPTTRTARFRCASGLWDTANRRRGSRPAASRSQRSSSARKRPARKRG